MEVADNLFGNNLAPGTRASAMVVGHQIGAVKEQSADLYAIKMAEQGFVTLSIDRPFWGGSESEPRNAAASDLYSVAFSAGGDFLHAQDSVNGERIDALGICGSAVRTIKIRVRSGGSVQYITTFGQAEQNAAQQMRALGYADARVTPPGADGGIDVLSSTAVAQVKWRGAQVSRPDLQRLYGARGGRNHLDMLFFAATKYSGPAIEYANAVDIALFVYSPTGDLDPVSRSAQRLVAKARNRMRPGGKTGPRAVANHAHTPAVTTATATSAAKHSDAWMLRAQERLAEVAQRLDAHTKARETGRSRRQRVNLSKRAPQRPDPWRSHAKTRLSQVAQRLESKAASRATEPQHSNSSAKQRTKDHRDQIQTLKRINAASPNRHPRPGTVDTSFPPPRARPAPKRAFSGWMRELAIAGSLGLGLLAVGFLVIAVAAMNSEEPARTWIAVMSLLVAAVSGGASFALIVRLRQ